MTFLNEQKEHENFHLEEKGGKKAALRCELGFSEHLEMHTLSVPGSPLLQSHRLQQESIIRHWNISQ